MFELGFRLLYGAELLILLKTIIIAFKKKMTWLLLQQHSHSRVPKFGNWESGDTPYTAYFYFDNVRKERTQVLRMNPNDPEENPEAFINADYSIAQAPLRVKSRQSISPVDQNDHVVGKVTHRGNHRNLASESGSNSDYSLLQHNHRHDRSHDKKKSTLAEGISGFSSSSSTSASSHGKQKWELSLC